MVTLLDGSIGQELVHRLGKKPTPLWSTAVMLEAPELVADVHKAYFDAGAEIATTNSYPVLRDRLAKNGVEDQFEALHRASLDIARTARAAHGSGRVATSLGPLGASYRPDLAPDVGHAADLYAEIVDLHNTETDLFLIETVSGLRACEGVLAGTKGATKPVWLALSTQDADGTKLRSGEALADVAPLVERFQPDAVLINCTTPEATGPSLEIIKDFGLPFGAYANGFTKISDGFKVANPTVEALSARTDLGPAAYADFCEAWVEIGASIIGGCCEVGPAHIAELKRRFG